MKYSIIGFIIGFIITIGIYFLKSPKVIVQTQIDTVYIEKRVNIDVLIRAIAWVESRWNDSVVSNKNAKGYLQITYVVIEEANRLGGNFTHNDAFNREKSIEIFKIIMGEHNPNYDINRACKIWNPKAKLSYHTAVENKYNELINERIIL